uniref:Uncharacterized protein n=1 Tax=Arundo donax TaxID=35708 RepID=A0A0A8ZWW0_ARUDO
MTTSKVKIFQNRRCLCYKLCYIC